MRVVVVGGGAAGFFAAIRARERHPQASVVVLERSRQPLAKVRISGGGRCNVTHDEPTMSRFVRHYPRGGPFLRKVFSRFGQPDTVKWFQARGVPLKTEEDGRMFPESDDSGTVVDLLLAEAHRLGVDLRTGHSFTGCEPLPDGTWRVGTREHGPIPADRVVVAMGGHPKADGYTWAEDLGIRVEKPVPSLFTFNLPNEPIRELMGVVADPVRVAIAGTSLEASGALLITHWGFSGPAVLRLSAWGARTLHAMDYRCTVRVDWTNGAGEQWLLTALREARDAHPERSLRNTRVFPMAERLWSFLLAKAHLDPSERMKDIAGKDINRLVDVLVNDRYTASGKTTFKEEFVTAGGIALDQVDPATMACRKHPGLFFAGEVLDIDGITGGFNFQSAWSTGWIAGHLGDPFVQ
jgi:predicted Rossmann fold flavoprotein